MGRYCCFDNCRSDSRCQKNVTFHPVPKPGKKGKNLAITQKWIEAINRETITVSTLKKHHHVCNLHFVDGKGPTKENPFPSRLLNEDARESDTSNLLNVNKIGMKTYSKHELEIKTERDPVLNSTEVAQASSTENVENMDDSDTLLINNPKDEEFQSYVNVNSTKSQSLMENSGQEILIESSEPVNKRFSLDKLREELLVHQKENKETFMWTIASEPNLLILYKRKGNLLTVRFEISESLDVEVLILEKRIEKTQYVSSNGDQIKSTNELINMTSNFDCNWSVCWGVSDKVLDIFLNKSSKSAKYCPESNSLRSIKCQYIKKKSMGWCKNCRLLRQNLFKTLKRKKNCAISPKQTTLCNLDLRQIRMRMMAAKLKNQALTRKNKSLRKQVDNLLTANGTQLTKEENAELVQILQDNPFETPNKFQRFLLHQQLQLANSNVSRPKKWHPAIIHWCLYLKSKSSSFYEALRQVMTLPTARTLHNYSKDLRNESGFKASSS